MFGRFKQIGFIAAVSMAVSVLVSIGFSQSGTSGSTGALSQQSPMAVINIPVDSPESLQRKNREILSWTPKQADRLAYALKDVKRIIRFGDLGFGDRMEVTMPGEPSRDWPIASAVRVHLGREKTAIVTRFKIDTLPVARVRGEGMLGLMGVHGDSLTGRDIELKRTMASTGRIEFLFIRDILFGATSCCNLPSTFTLDRYGKARDTMTMIFTFDPSTTDYMVSVIGPEAGRTFPGFSYGMFRTERGEFHRELDNYPYVCKDQDSSYVNLYVGSRFRGRKSQQEPILKVNMF